MPRRSLHSRTSSRCDRSSSAVRVDGGRWCRYVLKSAGDIRDGYKRASCEFRVDYCTCLNETGPISTALVWIAYVQMLVAVIELCGYFLKVAHHIPIAESSFGFLVFGGLRLGV